MLGRIFMRLVFPAEDDTLGFETAMGAIIGDFTAGGTLFIGIFGALMGLVLGAGSVALTAAPVPILIERFAPSRGGQPRRAAYAVTIVGAAAIAVYSATAVAAAYGA